MKPIDLCESPIEQMFFTAWENYVSRHPVGLLEDAIGDTEDPILSEACLRKAVAEKVKLAVEKLKVVK